MTGILALFGSGEFTPAMDKVDAFLLSKTKSPRIAILPTAAGQESDHIKWIEMAIDHYKKFRLAAQGFDIKDREGANSKVYAEELNDYNYFVFSGGDPGYLLDTMQGSLVWKNIKKLYEKGATLIGSSAGAMAFGAKTWDTKSVWKKGLGLTDFGVIPHYDYIKKEFNAKKLEKIRKSIPRDIRIIGIEEDTAYIKIKSKWITLGKGKVENPAKI